MFKSEQKALIQSTCMQSIDRGKCVESSLTLKYTFSNESILLTILFQSIRYYRIYFIHFNPNKTSLNSLCVSTMHMTYVTARFFKVSRLCYMNWWNRNSFNFIPPFSHSLFLVQFSKLKVNAGQYGWMNYVCMCRATSLNGIVLRWLFFSFDFVPSQKMIS